MDKRRPGIAPFEKDAFPKQAEFTSSPSPLINAVRCWSAWWHNISSNTCYSGSGRADSLCCHSS